MRLPGFYHRKDPNNPFFVNVLKAESTGYSLDKLLEAFPKPEQKRTASSDVKGSHTEVHNYIEKLNGAIEGQSGDLKTFQVACDLVRGFNLSVDEALIYFRKFNEKCIPTWSESELMGKLESAKKSGSGDFGYLLKNLTTEQWVYRFIEKNNVKTSYNQKIYFNGDIVPVATLIRKAEIQWDSEGKRSKINVIKSIFEEWESDTRKGIIKRVRERFKHNANKSYVLGDDPITRFTRAIVGEKCEDFDQHRAVIAHFIWQTKRKIFGLHVNHHMCPVFVGKQGSGKTQAIENLIKPLKFLSIDANLGTFVREAERFVFGTYYIVKLDEFANGRKSDLETMKHIITSDDINYRTFYTQKMAFMPNVSTFIGASNRSVAEIFNDQTGSRRFYEIPCLDKLDWDQIGGNTEDEGIDYFSLWISIDENDESPIAPFISSINSYQEKFRARSIVEEWLASEDLKPQPTDLTEIVALKTLHRDFINWMREQNCNFPYTDQRFGRDLSKHLEQKKRNNGSHYVVKAKPPLQSGALAMSNLSSSQILSGPSDAVDEVEKMLADALNTPISLHRNPRS